MRLVRYLADLRLRYLIARTGFGMSRSRSARFAIFGVPAKYRPPYTRWRNYSCEYKPTKPIEG